MKVRIAAIYREEIYSNHAVDVDRAIMDSLIGQLKHSLGGRVEFLLIRPEHDLQHIQTCDLDLVMTMTQSAEALKKLEQVEQKGICVINSSRSINNCMREKLSALLKDHSISYPNFTRCLVSDLRKLSCHWSKGYWIKRSDFHAVYDDDVIFCENQSMLDEIEKRFEKKKIENVIVQEHCPGELFKFYGVRDSYLTLRYIGKIGKTRFNLRSGDRDCKFDHKKIESDIQCIASHLNLDFFGGDFIVDKNGDCHFIDFNDWPSFRTCRDQVSVVMASYIQRKMSWY